MAIDERLKVLEGQDTDECESALEALGQIGTCKYADVYGLPSNFIFFF